MGERCPSCQACNAKKQQRDWRDYIIERAGPAAGERHARVTAFLKHYKYKPSFEPASVAEASRGSRFNRHDADRREAQARARKALAQPTNPDRLLEQVDLGEGPTYRYGQAMPDRPTCPLRPHPLRLRKRGYARHPRSIRGRRLSSEPSCIHGGSAFSRTPGRSQISPAESTSSLEDRVSPSSWTVAFGTGVQSTAVRPGRTPLIGRGRSRVMLSVT